MTFARTRVIVTGDRQALRLRLAPGLEDETAVEVTQIRARRDGFEAETARSFVPLDHIDAVVAALLAIRAEAQLAAYSPKREGRLRRAIAMKATAPEPRRAQPQGEF